jgi:hypothetical protein
MKSEEKESAFLVSSLTYIFFITSLLQLPPSPPLSDRHMAAVFLPYSQ